MVKLEGTSFVHDSVMDFTPITFAGTFVRTMRQAKGLANIPSIRTTIAIPQFLSARYWRQEKLDPIDYVEAAVYNTPYEDQKIAYKIAYQMMFPKQFEREPTGTIQQVKPRNKKSTLIHTKTKAEESSISGLDQIFNELSAAGFDDLLEAMDDSDLDDLMAEQQTAWEFLDQLLQSSDPRDAARLDLLHELESEYSIVQHHLDSRELIDNYISQLLAQLAGTWSPTVFQPGTMLGMQEQLQRQAQMPWEQAAAMTAANHPETQNYLQNMLQQDAHTLGTTLRYLAEQDKSPSKQWQDQAFDRIKTMADYHAMLKGMQQFREPPAAMLKQAVNNMGQAMKLAEQIDTEFGSDVQAQTFDQFLQHSTRQPPSVQQVQHATFDNGQQSWEELLDQAVRQEARHKNSQQLTELAKSVASHNTPQLSTAMKRHQTKLAQEVATKSMEQIATREQFLPELDHLLQHQIQPELSRVLRAGTKHGIPEEEIAEMYQGALQLLQAYIEGENRKKDNYNRVVRQLSKQQPNTRGGYQQGVIPEANMQHMMQQAVDTNNSMAMAALGAVDLGQAMQTAAGIRINGQSAQQQLINALDKSIGGGTNLLQQWFLHRRHLPNHLKQKLKGMMREVLLEIGMNWANRGTGSSEEGLIPVNTTRPYRPGDEFDLIDIEATLDTLMMSGKTLDQITEDELMVMETSKGKSAIGVLIDISGSMSGKDLAMCAIAVVMLLGKLEAKEVAIALFESNTHTIKGFEEEIELDKVADELLDLQATGGTRADAALRWMANEFEHVPEAEVKIMYFLSDFYLSEQQPQLTLLCDPMITLGVKILAAYHSNYERQRMEHMVELLEGTSMQIKNFEHLPGIISEAIENLQ